MSHQVRVKTAVTDQICFVRTCTRLNYQYRIEQDYNSEIDGCYVKLPGWQYEVQFNTQGQAVFDNYSSNYGNLENAEQLSEGGRWGDSDGLRLFLREYAREAARMSAEEQGYMVLSEEETVEGGIVMTLAGV